ncbi:MAG: hypothetical protein II956_03370 [Bacteroidales bacterium]|nr:hypothetical protein [Bacteroidales bacterium]
MKRVIFMLLLIAAVLLPSIASNFNPVPPERIPAPRDSRIPIPGFPPTIPIGK